MSDTQKQQENKQTQQENKTKWNAEIKNNSLLIEYLGNVYYKGWLNQVPTYLSLDFIKDTVMKGQVEILSKTSTNMRIRIMAIINLEIHNQEYLEIQSLKKRVKQLEDDVKENENLKKKVKELEEKKWVEQDLNSTQPFDIDCVYRIKLNNGYSAISIWVNTSQIYHMNSRNTVYYIKNTNRKSSTLGWTVNKIWKQKVQ